MLGYAVQPLKAQTCGHNTGMELYHPAYQASTLKADLSLPASPTFVMLLLVAVVCS
jgi:hypothetical protein